MKAKTKLTFLICLTLLLPTLGEFGRINLFGLDFGFLYSDLILPPMILYWLISEIPKRISSRNKFIYFSIFGFLFIASFSLLLSLLSLPTKEVIQSAFYLIRFTEYAMLFPLTYSILDTKKQTKPFNTLFKTTILSSLIIAIGGFIQLVIYPDLKKLAEFGFDPHINRLVSTWLDPNFIGGFFAFIICILLGIILHSKN